MSQRQRALADDDIAGEDRAVGAVLDLDPVGGDVDRRVVSWPFSADTGRSLRQRPAPPSAISDDQGDKGETLHHRHLTAPCTIFKRTLPSSTTSRAPRSALSRPASNSPSRIAPADPAAGWQLALA